MKKGIVAMSSLIALSGCAGLEFGTSEKANSLPYFEPVPYLLVNVTKECVATATVVSLPGAEKRLRIKNGYGTSDVSLAFNGGLITSVGQKTDTKVPEGITALGTALGLGAFADKAGGASGTCAAKVKLYSIVGGRPGMEIFDFLR